MEVGMTSRIEVHLSCVIQEALARRLNALACSEELTCGPLSGVQLDYNSFAFTNLKCLGAIASFVVHSLEAERSKKIKHIKEFEYG